MISVSKIHGLRYVITFFVLFSVTAVNAGESNILRYRQPESKADIRYQYFLDILDLVLQRTETEYGPLKPVSSKIYISQERAFELVKDNKYLDIVWGMTSVKREAELLPIRVPLLMGLLGCRVAIVRKDKIGEFSGISTLDDLKQYTIVQGNDWPDVSILRYNGLNVVTSPSYNGMFSMIHDGRVDLFLRGITEAWLEIEKNHMPDLAIEPRLLLVYPGPIYFFVNKDRKKLADRLMAGLAYAQEDGSFNTLINQHPDIIRAKNKLLAHSRTIIGLTNPALPDKTPVQENQLWMTLNVGDKKVKCITK